MLGYGTANSTSEYLVVMKDPHDIKQLETPGEPDIYQIRTSVSDYALKQNGLFAHPSKNFQLIMVTDTTIEIIQVYPARSQSIKSIDTGDTYVDATFTN